MLHIEYARKKLTLDARYRQLVWLKGPKKGAIAGEYRGTHIMVMIAGTRYRAADIAWLLQTGTWPSSPVTVANGDHKDLLLGNLVFEQVEQSRPINWSEAQTTFRDATTQRLARSAKRQSPTGIKGVLPYPGDRFKAQVYSAGKCKHLGIFATVEEASNAIEAWKDNEAKRLIELRKPRWA